jgi:hypothetical protein
VTPEEALEIAIAHFQALQQQAYNARRRSESAYAGDVVMGLELIKIRIASHAECTKLPILGIDTTV